MKVKKTSSNPHGLSNKQKLVMEDMLDDASHGKPIRAIESVRKFYDTKPKNLYKVTNQVLNNENFRQALIEGLKGRKILGANSIVEQKLDEGLDALTEKGEVDYKARLAYIQEINKIAGVYAPEKKSSLNLNLDMTEEDLDKHIRELTDELE
jgi:hypothetical protein